MNTARTPGFWDRRRTLLYAVLWMGVFLVDGLGLWVLDLIFNGQKADLILSYRGSLRHFSEHASLFQTLFAGRAEPAVYPHVVARLNAVIESPDTFFYGYAFYRFADPAQGTLRETPELERYNYGKFRQRNDFTNCFISRRYNSFYRVPVDAGYLQLYYTTPPNVPGLPALVGAFWAIASAFLATTWLLAWLALRFLLRPLINVSTRLDMPFGHARAILPAGGSALEESYNRLAINAYRAGLTARLTSILSETTGRGGERGAETRRALGVLVRECGASQAALYTLDRQAGQLLRGESCHALPAVPPGLSRRSLELAGRVVRTEELTMAGDPDPAGTAALLLPIVSESGDLPALLLLWKSRAEALALDPRLHPALASALEIFLLRSQHREMLLEQEKTAVGIHLATNMGHDLTNVIATARLDLASLEKARERGLLCFDAERGRPAEAALEGLGSSFRLLQEVVELYRAYGYAERPTMAPLDLGELAEKVCGLFRSSSSQRVRVELQREPAAAPYVGEARLLSLAIYNLLNNAVEAVLGAGVERPVVAVHIGREADGAWRIAVTDNGPGIRDAGGRLLEPWEIKTIFGRGYTTKSAGGTGLGLSWVKQIVEEVHGGGLRMENAPEGGARATLLLPPAPPSPPTTA